MSMAFDKEYICISNHAPIKGLWIEFTNIQKPKKTKTKQEQNKIMLTPSQKAPKTPLPLKKQKKQNYKKKCENRTFLFADVFCYV